MKPHSIATIHVHQNKTLEQLKALSGWAGRHGYIVGRPCPWKKGDKLPETQVPSCPRVKVDKLPVGLLKQKWFERLEQDQKLASCCRHPENHFVEARKSHKDEAAPDIYWFICDECKRKHVFFCIGIDDVRPTWDAS